MQSVHAVPRNALESAVREEVIPRNVAKLVRVSTPKYTVNRGLSVAQARQVLQTASGERLYALYVLALCLGLRWEEIDLDAGRLPAPLIGKIALTRRAHIRQLEALGYTVILEHAARPARSR